MRPGGTGIRLACSKRSDRGELCEVKKVMKNREGLGREVRRIKLKVRYD